MPSRDAPPNIRALLQAIQREHGTNDIFEALAIHNSLNGNYAEPKWVKGHNLLRDDPDKWFRGTQIDERDLALINASPLPWVDIGKQSTLKHVVCANPQLNPQQHVCYQKADDTSSTTSSRTSPSRRYASLPFPIEYHTSLLLTMISLDLLDC